MQLYMLLFFLIAPCCLIRTSFARISCPQNTDCILLNDCTARHQHASHPLPPLSKCSTTQDKFCCPRSHTVEKENETPSPSFYDSEATPETKRTDLADRLEKHINRRLLPPPDACGKPSKYMIDQEYIKNKISDGKPALKGQIPWMALLFYGASDEQVAEHGEGGHPPEERGGCGGTLINSRYVLTAAHCLQFNNDTVLKHVTIGSHNIEETCERTKFIINHSYPNLLDLSKQCPINVKIEKIIIHPKFNDTATAKGQLKNDIGLLRLEKDALPKGNEYIGLACLPFSNFKTVDLNESFFASGWGAKKYDRDEFPEIEKTLRTVNISGSGVCNMCEGSDRSALCPLNNQTQLCVQGHMSSKDVCKGDSGGPLMVWRDQRWVQVGIVSAKATEKCGAQGVPSLFTRVDGFLEWILDEIEP